MGDTTVDPGPGAPGTEGAGTGQAPATTPPQDDNGQQPGPGAPNQQPKQGDDKPAKTDLSTLPQDVQKLIEGLRDENGKHRAAKQSSAQAAEQAKQQRAAVLRAFGLTEDGSDEPLTEQQLQERIDEANDAAWAMGVENVLLRNRDIDATELLDSRAFLRTLDEAGLTDRDPQEPDFAKDLASHVAQYVKENPRFKAKPPGAARSGGDHPGGSGAPRTRPGLANAIANQMGGSK